MKARSAWVLLFTAALAACGDKLPFDPSESDCAGDYSYYQLALWEANSFKRVNVQGVTFYDLDESKSCLALGVVAWSVVPAVEARLQELGIPRDAVYISVRPYAVLL